MSALDPNGRRQFLKFVTGTPRLPIGGFGALRPRLTVVKKEVDVAPGGTADNHLPSCSTCQVCMCVDVWGVGCVVVVVGFFF